MIDIATIDDMRLTQTLRLMKAQFIKRGWKAEVPYVGSSHCFIERSDRRKLHVFSATPPTSSFAVAHLANDKFATYQVLLEAGLPQLNTIMVDDTTPLDDKVSFLNRMKKIVVKPVDGAHGKGVTVGVTTTDKLQPAIDQARSAASSISAVLLQEQYPHEQIYELRVICINYEFKAAIWRVAARVYGDGDHTVRQLIEMENASSRRGTAYLAPLATIDVSRVSEYLAEKIDTVPNSGEEVTVLGIANYGAGGETVDMTDDIPDWLKLCAEKTARTMELSVAGVDFMLAQKPTTQSTNQQLNPIITEVNKCPSLAIHDIPTSGESRGVVGSYVDYLATL